MFVLSSTSPGVSGGCEELEVCCVTGSGVEGKKLEACCVPDNFGVDDVVFVGGGDAEPSVQGAVVIAVTCGDATNGPVLVESVVVVMVTSTSLVVVRVEGVRGDRTACANFL